MTAESANTQTDEIAWRYIHAWNEADRATRRSLVQQLYAPTSRLVTAGSDCHGLDEIVEHVDRVVADFIGPDKHRFRSAGLVGHHDWLLLRWEMVTSSTGTLADWGVNVLIVGANRQIEVDTQFVAPPWDD